MRPVRGQGMVGEPSARAAVLAAGRAAGAILLVLILPPTLFSRRRQPAYDEARRFVRQLHAQPITQLFTSRFFSDSLWNTRVYAVGSAIVAITLGMIQALIVERTNTPGRALVFLGAVISLGIPHVLYVVAWLLLLGRSGPVNELSAARRGLAASEPIDVYSMWGMILIEGVGFAPLTFLLMSAVLKVDRRLLRGSRDDERRPPLTTFWTVTLRMGLPGVLALLLLVFIRAFESFEVPALVGLAGNITVLTTDIYQSSIKEFRSVNRRISGAYSVCLLLIVALLLLWYNRLSRHAHQFQTITGKGYRPRVINLGRWRYLAAGPAAFSCSSSSLPLRMLVFASLQPFYEGVTADSLRTA